MDQVSQRFTFLKIAEDKRLVLAWASVVQKADGTPIVDHQGDVIEFDDLEAAFIEAFSGGGIAKGGEMHRDIGGADVVGQITLSRDERIAAGFGAGVAGALVKIRVTDDALWAKVKSGEYSELSIGGLGTREAL